MALSFVQNDSLRRHCIVAVKDESHLLKRMAAGLWISKVDHENEDEENDSKDDVILPTKSIQRNGVDECVEENGRDSSTPCDGKSARA